MEIKVLYAENISATGFKKYTTINLPDDEDYNAMLDADYERRLAEADPNKRADVQRCETVQEMFDLLNKEEYNTWHKYHRHVDATPKARRKDGRRGYIYAAPEEECFDVMEYIATTEDDHSNLEDEEVRTWISSALEKKPEWEKAFLACRIDGMSIRQYAKQIGDSENNITQKLLRAKKKLNEKYRDDFER